MKPLNKIFRGGLLPLLLLAGVVPVGCGKTTKYSFVDVTVQVDSSITRQELAARVDSCEIHVMGAEDVPGVSLPRCVMTAKAGYQLGTFEWTTTLERGQLQFEVTLFSFNREVLGIGTSAPVDIVAGKRAATSVLVIAMPAMTGTGGAGGSTGAGGGGGTTGAGGAGGAAGGGGGRGGSGVGGQAGSAAGGQGGPGVGGEGGSAAGGQSGSAPGGQGGSSVGGQGGLGLGGSLGAGGLSGAGGAAGASGASAAGGASGNGGEGGGGGAGGA